LGYNDHNQFFVDCPFVTIHGAFMDVAPTPAWTFGTLKFLGDARDALLGGRGGSHDSFRE